MLTPARPGPGLLVRANMLSEPGAPYQPVVLSEVVTPPVPASRLARKATLPASSIDDGLNGVLVAQAAPAIEGTVSVFLTTSSSPARATPADARTVESAAAKTTDEVRVAMILLPKRKPN